MFTSIMCHLTGAAVGGACRLVDRRLWSHARPGRAPLALQGRLQGRRQVSTVVVWQGGAASASKQATFPTEASN